MRKQEKWATFAMTLRDYIVATERYNAAWKEKCLKLGIPFIAKHPRAIANQISSFEKSLLSIIATGDFKCKCPNNH